MPKLRWLLLVAPLLMAQDYGSGVAHVGAVSGAPPAAAGGASVLYTQLFESDTSDCTAAGNDASDVADTPDCNHAEAPGPGDGSMFLDGQTAAAAVNADWDSSDGEFAACDATTCRLKFYMQVDQDGGTNWTQVVSMADAIDDDTVWIEYRGSNNDIRARCDDEADADALPTITPGVDYKICMEYDLVAEDGIVYVDTGATAFCTGGDGSSECDNNPTAFTEVANLKFRGAANAFDVIFDDLVFEEQ